MALNGAREECPVAMSPPDWHIERLGDLVDGDRRIRYGVVQPGSYDSQGCLLLRSQDYSRGWTTPERMFRVRAELAQQYRNARLKCGDLVLTVVGAGIGQVEAVPAWLDGAVLSRSTARIAIDPSRAAPEYVRSLLLGPLGRGQIMTHLKEGAQPVVSCADVSNFQFPFPPLPAQRSIAAALSDVDALLAALDRLIAKKRDLKQAVMQRLLSGKTRLTGFAGAWSPRRLGELGYCQRGVTYDGDRDLAAHDTQATKRLLRANNVQDSKIALDELQFVEEARVAPKQILRQNDILLCMANGSRDLVGKAALFDVADGNDYTFGAFMAAFRPTPGRGDPSFIFYLLQTQEYRDKISVLLAGSSINNLRPSAVASLTFSMPADLQEQSAIAGVLADIDAELAALDQRRTKTRLLKQGMMQELLTGKTRPA